MTVQACMIVTVVAYFVVSANAADDHADTDAGVAPARALDSTDSGVSPQEEFAKKVTSFAVELCSGRGGTAVDADFFGGSPGTSQAFASVHVKIVGSLIGVQSESNQVRVMEFPLNCRVVSGSSEARDSSFVATHSDRVFGGTDGNITRRHNDEAYQKGTEATRSVPLLGAEAVAGACIASLIFWLLLFSGCDAIRRRCKPTPLCTGIHRLALAQLHAAGAVACGLMLAMGYGSLPLLDLHFTQQHQVVFAISIGYRLASFLEGSAIATHGGVAGVSSGQSALGAVMAPRLRHCAVGVVLALSLATRRLSGFAVVCGLLGEIPGLLTVSLGAMPFLVPRKSVLATCSCNGIASGLRRWLLDGALAAAWLTQVVPLVAYVEFTVASRGLTGLEAPMTWAWHFATLALAASFVTWYPCHVTARAAGVAVGFGDSAHCHCVTVDNEEMKDTESGYIVNNDKHDEESGATTAVDADFAADGQRVDVAMASQSSAISSAVATHDGFVDLKDLRNHRTSESCCLAIRGTVYDVTKFLKQHPGGAERLLEWGGSDATDAFERVGHSETARAMLDGMAVAPLAAAVATAPIAPTSAGANAADRRYDILAEPPGALMLGKAALQVVGAGVWLISTRSVAGEVKFSRVLPFVAVMAAALGAVAPQRLSPSPSSLVADVGCSCWSVIAPAVGGAALSTWALTAATAPLKALSLGAAAALVVEAAPLGGSGRYPFPSHMGIVLISAHFTQALLTHIPCATGGGAVLLAGGTAFAFSLCLLGVSLVNVTRPAAASSLRAVAWWAACWSLGAWTVLQLLPVGAAANAAATSIDGLLLPHGIISATSPINESPEHDRAWGGVASVAIAGVFVFTLRELADHSSASAAVIWSSITLGLPAAVKLLYDAAIGGDILTPGIFIVIAWLLQARILAHWLEAETQGARSGGSRTSSRIGSNEGFRRPFNQAQFLVNTVRAFLGMMLWNIFGQLLEKLTSWVLPTGLRNYAFEAPIDDLGGRLQVGICLHLEGERVEPGHVVCNVGHLPTADLDDIRETVRTSLDIMEELGGVREKDPAPGFISNLLCVVPETAKPRPIFGVGWRTLKEINLSVWSSKEAAATWYRGSAAHTTAMRMHQGHGSGGSTGTGNACRRNANVASGAHAKTTGSRGRSRGLKTFGNLLLSLQPLRARWQRRCKQCTALAEGLDADTCPECGGATFPMSVF
eukprot:TRINITY_DN10301_c0_g1_i1.p1 TRINITY_DN10301_c0_g1~~TRINITY_DN10301_c0_g1_i1.p1  ORF type:complete len:1205 (+),score=185.24 TRINITY_DN10301_c0_g1_i1:80-3694(+)